ncbi:Glycosyltransferase involved in cell wall bisynthesis [Friedmanniella luteola]|uniref:Glycosyltransferase involved in cell wall bisynthesis n=1 Tax=Friedmanniella luteola TaxID=546871 RepID=A0A1H1PYH6_9ACTN|nr:Glycosyltransferase involved in cell wall bisynthesis [Friedmanniella luteola]
MAETLAHQFARTCRVTVVTMEPRLTPRELRATDAPPWTGRIPAGCHHVHLPAAGSGLPRLATLVVRFALLARREEFDAVYSFLMWTNVLVTLAKLLGGRYAHVASEHAMADTLRGDRPRLLSVATTLPVVYRRPDWIVVVSDAARASLGSAGLLPRPGRAVTIPNPVDGEEIRRLAAAPCDLPEPAADRVVLVCVGRLHEHKDHRTLLRAMTRLPEGYCLVLVGDGPLRDELAQDVDRLGLGGRVTFTGVLLNPYPLMRRADVVVLPSKQEGFGLIAAEAAALGRPFVGSAVGGLAELCALLGQPTVEVGDDAGLAATIVRLASEPSAGGTASALVDSAFDPAAIAARYLRLTSG